MNLADLRSAVSSRTDGLYAPAAIDSALNEGLTLFSFLTLCVERSTEIPADPGVSMWRMLGVLPDWIAPLRCRCRVVTSSNVSLWDQPNWDQVTFDQNPQATSTISPLRPASLSELEALDPAWQLARDNHITRYGCQGMDLFYVYPSPNSKNAAALLITYAAAASPMSSEQDIPEIPDIFHPALIAYALCTLPLTYGGSELQRTTEQWSKFLDAVQSCASYVRHRNRGLQYDTVPTELALADMSLNPKGKKQQ